MTLNKPANSFSGSLNGDRPRISTVHALTLGWVYYKKEMYPQALGALRHSIDKDPSNASAQYHLGLTCVRLNDLTGGRQALLEALRLNPKFDGAADAQAVLSRIGS